MADHRYLRIAVLLPTIAVVAAQSLCGSDVQILFQSNAYVESLLPGTRPNNYEGGSVISTKDDWVNFLSNFQPNVEGEELARTSIDFSSEKVAIGTYYASSSCSVRLEKARVECSSVLDDEGQETTTYGKFLMDVTDASRSCDMRCMALGQVVFAVTVPLAWEVDESSFEIDVSGGCAPEESQTTIAPPSGDECPKGFCLDPFGNCHSGEVQCFVDPCEVQSTPCGEGTECRANYCGGCNAICVPISTSTPAVDGISTTTNKVNEDCPENQCLNPDGECGDIVACAVSPCTFSPCARDEVCLSNYCGSCLYECIPMDEITTKPTMDVDSNDDCPAGECLDPLGVCRGETSCWTDPCEYRQNYQTPCEDGTVCRSIMCGGCYTECVEMDASMTSTTSTGIASTSGPSTSIPGECPENQCIGIDGECGYISQCGMSPCVFSSCADGEACRPNFCGGCNYECIPLDVIFTTTTSTLLDIPIDTTSTMSATSSSPELTDGEKKCGRHEIIFSGSAYASSLVPNGQNGVHIKIITSEEDLKNLVSAFEPTNPDEDDLSGFDNIDFDSEQLILVTYYTSSSCRAEFDGDFDFDCSTFDSSITEYSLNITMEVVDSSIGCEVACDAEIQLVFAVVTPLGGTPSFYNSVTGPCLVQISTDEENLFVTTTEAPVTESSNSETSTKATNAPATTTENLVTTENDERDDNDGNGEVGDSTTSKASTATTDATSTSSTEEITTAQTTTSSESTPSFRGSTTTTTVPSEVTSTKSTEKSDDSDGVDAAVSPDGVPAEIIPEIIQEPESAAAINYPQIRCFMLLSTVSMLVVL